MTRSAGTQAAIDAGYGSRAEFNRFRETPLYQQLAERWAIANGISVQSTRDPRSRFARAAGRAFYKKGTVRPEGKRPVSYVRAVVPDIGGDVGHYWQRYARV